MNYEETSRADLDEARRLARRMIEGYIPAYEPRVFENAADDLAECVLSLTNEVELLRTERDTFAARLNRLDKLLTERDLAEKGGSVTGER